MSVYVGKGYTPEARVPLDVLEDPDLGPEEIAVYAALSCNAERRAQARDDGWYREQFGQHLQMDRQQVEEVLETLAWSGWIERRDEGGYTVHYRLE